MNVVWILFVCSVVLLPGTALLALRWAARHGEFNDLPRTALSIFDEDEPIGVMSDHFPGGRAAARKENRAATGSRPNPTQQI
jgi:cbb3-type cytochrome oxidase maturation protein